MVTKNDEESWKEEYKSLGIPIGKTPIEITKGLNPALSYLKNLGEGWSVGNFVYLVGDNRDNFKKVLKIAASPINLGRIREESRLLKLLNETKVAGIPKLFESYNTESPYDSSKHTAFLREYVDAEKFNDRLRTHEDYSNLKRLLSKMRAYGVGAPKDFSEDNILVDKNGKIFIIDLEECSSICDEKGILPRWNGRDWAVYEDTERLIANRGIKYLKLFNVWAHLERSRNPIVRLLSKSKDLVELANWFY